MVGRNKSRDRLRFERWIYAPQRRHACPGRCLGRIHRLNALSQEKKEKFLPLAPDFATEVRSQNDARSDLEAKMEEYIDNGTRLGWLIDPYEETVTVYHEDGSSEEFEKPATLSGEPVLPGFECNLERIWSPSY